jgi:hypothetical protein
MNRTQWGLWIPLGAAIFAMTATVFLVGFQAAKDLQPAPATSDEVWYCHGTPCPPQDAIEIQIGNIYKQIGIPACTDTESGQMNNSKCGGWNDTSTNECMFGDVPIQPSDDDCVWGSAPGNSGECSLNPVPLSALQITPTSTAWSCPLKDLPLSEGVLDGYAGKLPAPALGRFNIAIPYHPFSDCTLIQ